MKSTIRTEAGVLTISALIGRVDLNGRAMLPHEAFLIGSEFQRAAQAAQDLASRAAQGTERERSEAGAVAKYAMKAAA